MQLYREDSNLIRIKIHSRHVTSQKYKLWIEYGKNNTAFNAWYCLCSFHYLVFIILPVYGRESKMLSGL